MPPTLTISPLAARWFMRRAQHFDEPFADISGALSYLGFVQVDPINVCGRMHDLILRHRIVGYREGDLMRFLHEHENSKGQKQISQPAEERTAFEHHLPDTNVLVAFTLDAWPHLLAAMRARAKRTGAWSGRLTPRERALAPALLAEIAARGPLGSENFADDRRAHRPVWGKASLVKSTLQKLFFHGRLLIAQRVNNRRRYDLPERVLPAATLAAGEPPPGDTARWLVLLKLKQRRLVLLKRDELRHVGDVVAPVRLENGPTLYCLRSDVAELEAAVQAASAGGLQHANSLRPRLLAPLDPIIYDRRVTASVWNFDYTWEAYTPPRKRVRGYYALPVLAGLEIVGHVDPKADRTQRRLAIVSRRIRRGYALRETLRDFAGWLGLKHA